MRVKMAQRMLWLSVIALGIFGSLGFRVYQLQMEQTDRGHDLLQAVYSQRTQSLSLQMRRGRILDRNGVDLTDPESTFGLGVFPRLLGDLAEVEQRLGTVLSPQQVALVLEHARQSPQPAWVVEGGLSDQMRERIDRLKIPGIVVGPTGRRYGAKSLARHLVGYANGQGGQQGLERAFEGELQGNRVPYLVATFDGRDRPLFGIRRMVPETGKEPYDLITTLDARMQRVVEREMDATMVAGSMVLRGAVVVMDARSGEVLALASRPDYDQMSLPVGDRYSPLVNRALLAYEPGSVFKSLVAAAALEEGEVSLEESFDCQGRYELSGATFGDANGKGHGSITFRDAVAQSCNITFIQVGYERLGAARLLETARKFGLGSPTGIYPGADESSGSLPALAYGGDVAQFSFGQGGLMATPVQVARAYAAIANGGTLPPVRLVTAVKKPSGEVMARPETAQARRIISRETARQMQEALRGVTDPTGQGTGRAAWVEGYGSAGKTGSAETVHDGRPVTHAWFAGWTPVESPRYVIVVLAEDGRSGGAVAAPLFRRIAEGIHGL